MHGFFDLYDHQLMPEPNSGCLIWIGAQISAGYGHGHRDGEHFYAHRAAFECVNGAGSAAGIVVRHQCDFPPCCNPDHLLGGTHADNQADMRRRGRDNNPTGERVNTAVLIEQDVIEIRRMAAAGASINEITALFPIRRNAITAVVVGQTWKHLGPGVEYVREKVAPPIRRGEESHKAILTEAEARAIKRRANAGEKGVHLAIEFGVSQCTISAIKTGRNWPHLTEESNET